MNQPMVRITRLIPGQIIEVSPAIANAVVREILQQTAPFVARAAGDIEVTRESLEVLLAPFHSVSSRRAGRLWGRMRHAYTRSGITLMCRLCDDQVVNWTKHTRHQESDEYLSAFDILANRGSFESNKVRGAGVAINAEFRLLCIALEAQLGEG